MRDCRAGPGLATRAVTALGVAKQTVLTQDSRERIQLLTEDKRAQPPNLE